MDVRKVRPALSGGPTDKNLHRGQWLQRQAQFLSTVSVMFGIYALLQATCYLLGWDMPAITGLRSASPGRPDITTAASEAHKILAQHPLIDGHNDLLFLIRALHNNQIYPGDFRSKFAEGGLRGQVDSPKLDHGQVGGTFWSAWVPCPARKDDHDHNFADEVYAPYVRATLEQIDLFHRLSSLYPKYFTPSASVAAGKASFSEGRLISPIAIEGLHQIGNSAATLRHLYSLGVRYATLTWNCHNSFADAAVEMTANDTAVPATPFWHGVSPAGVDMIHEMNRLGMLVDLAHVSPDTMRDVLAGTNHYKPSSSPSKPIWNGSIAPPIFSHSSVHAICPHPRNVPDDVLHLVKQRNSVVMINFSPDFIACEPDPENPTGSLPRLVQANATLAQVVRHIVYIGELVGYDHVGIGSDFDGIPDTPKGLEGVDKFPDLVAALLVEGVRREDVVKVIGGNILRVWGEAERVAARMKKEGWLPLEDKVKINPGGGDDVEDIWRLSRKRLEESQSTSIAME